MPIGLGNLLGSLSPGKTQQHVFNSALQGELGNAPRNLASSRAANTATANRFALDVDQALNNIRGLDLADQELISGLISRQNSLDPMADFRTIRSENLSALGDLSNVLGNVGRRQMNLSLAGLGLGGGAGSAYQDILNQGRVNTAIAPIANSIFNNLSRDAASVNTSRLNNLASTLGLIDTRAQVPVRGLNLRALPVNLRNVVDTSYLQGLGSIANSSRANTAGFEYRPSPLEATGGLIDGIVDTALDLYGGGFFGGGGRSPSPATGVPFTAPVNPYFGPGF